MGLKRLTTSSSGAIAFEQAGYDLVKKNHQDVAGDDHVIYYAGAGNPVDNNFYLDIGRPYWIGIHNCGVATTIIPVPIQAECAVGDNLTNDPSSSFDYDTARYLNLAPGDIIYGKFTSVGILKSDGPQNYIYFLRLIRGV